MIGVYDMIDQAISEALGVPVEEYIDVIENCSYWEAYYVTTVFWFEREDKYERAKEIYNSCKEKFLNGK